MRQNKSNYTLRMTPKQRTAYQAAADEMDIGLGEFLRKAADAAAQAVLEDK